MAKTDVTKLIERYLERDYRPSSMGGIRVNKMRPSFVGLEVPVECGTIRKGLVDAIRIDECFLPADTGDGCRELLHKVDVVGGILFTAFEIKVTVADFHSKNGHNFCGNCNFYVVPHEIYPQIKDLVPEHVGILVFYDGRQEPSTNGSFPYYGVKKKKDCIYQALSEADQLWLLMSTMKRVVKGQKALYDELLASGGYVRSDKTSAFLEFLSRDIQD